MKICTAFAIFEMIFATWKNHLVAEFVKILCKTNFKIICEKYLVVYDQNCANSCILYQIQMNTVKITP